MHADKPPYAPIFIIHAKCNEELEEGPVRLCSGPIEQFKAELVHSVAEGALRESKQTYLFNCGPVRRSPLGPECLSPQWKARCSVARSPE